MKTRIFLTAVVLFLTTFLNAEALNAKGKSTDAFINHFVEATDAELSLENWMVNECYWKCMEFNCLSRDFDQTLVLEPWMTNVGRWEFDACVPVDAETPKNLESWMTDIESWEANNQFPAAQESPLGLESWMTDGKVWNSGSERFAVTGE